MQALKPIKEEKDKSTTSPFVSVSPFNEKSKSEEGNEPVGNSFMSMAKESAYLAPRWNVGIEPRRVTVYVMLALIAGFALGFIASHFIINKNAASENLASSGRQPRNLASASSSTSGATEFHRVSRITRGDTIEVEGVGLVRMIGIETPDGKAPQELYGPFGQQALTLAKSMLAGEEVRLELDPATKADGDKDQTGQTLAYVYKKDGTLVNGELLKQGLAFVRTGEQFRLSDTFRSLERDAMQSSRGIWGASSVAQNSSEQPGGPGVSPSPSENKPKLSPLLPSAIGPNIPATTTGPTAPSEPLVFISSDKRFHNKSSCDLLGKKKDTLGVSVAKAQGYTACSRCYPSHTMQVR